MNKIVIKHKVKNSNLNSYQLRPMLFSALLANLFVFAILGYCYWLIQNNKELFYLTIVQEDGYIEWATTWAFLLASIGCIFGVILRRKNFRGFQWFYIGLSLFCFLVAMEEISWGQRFLGYRAPNYFLKNNFQQELTVHNMVSDSIRDITLKVIILGYGVVLPLLMLIPSLRRLLNLMGVVVPPLELIPAFLSVLFVYQIHPWQATGEVIEFMMGLSFLFAVSFRLWDYIPVVKKSREIWQLITILGVTFVTIGLGFVTTNLSTHKIDNNSMLLNTCQKELETIKRDFIWKASQTGPSFKGTFHLRLYSAVKKYNLTWMYQRQFSSLTSEGLSQDRADFFIDPWNMPYWMIFKIDKTTSRKRVVIYSFGPNRKRDSNDWVIKGDDIGVILLDTGMKRPYIQ